MSETIQPVSFLIRDTVFKRDRSNVRRWLVGAKVGSTVVKMITPETFFQELESMNGFIAMTDLLWVNEICRRYLGRFYNQPQIEIVKPEPKRNPEERAEWERKRIESEEAAVKVNPNLRMDRSSMRR